MSQFSLSLIARLHSKNTHTHKLEAQKVNPRVVNEHISSVSHYSLVYKTRLSYPHIKLCTSQRLGVTIIIVSAEAIQNNCKMWTGQVVAILIY